MANSGYIQENAAFGYVRLSWSIKSQSIENNTSTIEYNLSIYRSSEIESTRDKKYAITINGLTVASGSNKIGGTGTKTLKTGTVVVGHNEDGSKTLSLGFKQEIAITWSGDWIGTLEKTGTGVLNPIPRPTKATFSAKEIFMDSETIIDLTRKKESFTHNLTVVFGDVSEIIATGVETQTVWNPASSIFARGIPNSLSGTALIVCETYDNGKFLGTQTTEIVLKIPETVVPVFGSPDFTIVDTVEEIREKFSVLIQNVSKPLIAVHANGIYGSTITACKVTFDGNTYNNQSVICGKISGSGSMTISATVTDSRGMSATQTKTIEVLEYSVPMIKKFNAFRCDANGNENPDGTRLNMEISYEITPLNNLNNKEYTLQYCEVGVEEWTTIRTNSSDYSFDGNVVSTALFDAEKPYWLKLIVSDFLNETDKTISIATAFTLLDFKANGKGLALGKVSEIDDVLDIGFKTKFTGGITLPVLSSGTNFDSLTISNRYALDTGAFYINSPLDGVEGILDIIGREDNVFIQRFSTISKDNKKTFERVFDSNGWGAWADTSAEIIDIRSEIEKIKKEMFLIAYPVGSLYMSTNSTDPGTLFGGTWEKIEDVFLVAAGSNFEAGKTSGKAEHTFSVNHKHISPLGYNDVSVGGLNINGTVTGGNGKAYRTATITAKGTLNANVDAYYTSNATVEATIPTIPPNLAVHVWKRLPDPMPEDYVAFIDADDKTIIDLNDAEFMVKVE